jgi:hypothetical protein
VTLALGLAKSAAASAPTATLTLGVGSISFPSASPATTPSIAATQNPISVTVRTTNTTTWSLTVLANGDLVAGANTIAISNVTWTATGTGFVAGTMSKTTAHTVASGAGNVNRTGRQSYFLANSWTYRTGSYSQTVVYTLTAQ